MTSKGSSHSFSHLFSALCKEARWRREKALSYRARALPWWGGARPPGLQRFETGGIAVNFTNCADTANFVKFTGLARGKAGAAKGPLEAAEGDKTGLGSERS
jgi:hypothetical protein